MSEVNWYKNKVNLVVNEHVQQSLEAIAFRIEKRAKVNINEAPGASGQGLIDTSFMINSTYVVLPDQSTYDQANQSGMYTDRLGRQVERILAPQRPLGDAGAMVAVGAEYAIYQETEHQFLFKAVEETAAEIGALVKIFNAR